jgi:hypothetical protein
MFINSVEIMTMCGGEGRGLLDEKIRGVCNPLNHWNRNNPQKLSSSLWSQCTWQRFSIKSPTAPPCLSPLHVSTISVLVGVFETWPYRHHIMSFFISRRESKNECLHCIGDSLIASCGRRQSGRSYLEWWTCAKSSKSVRLWRLYS